MTLSAPRWMAVIYLALAAGFTHAACAGTPALTFLERRVASDPLDNVAQNRLTVEYLNALRDTGDLRYLARAERAARASLQAVPEAQNPDGLTLLAMTRYESHRFREALALAKRAHRIDRSQVMSALTIGDSLYELGYYAAAERTYAELAARKPSAAVRSRQARMAELRGDTQRAIALLTANAAAGEDALWARVRLSELHFRQGDFDRAQRELHEARRIHPDSYIVQEHQAELLAARGQTARAMALYRTVIARVPRPELMQALGDLYAFVGNAAEAKRWHARALELYLQSITAGQVYYYHHLTGFYADSQPDPARALWAARRDLEQRDNIYSREALAWALYKTGDYHAAARVMDTVLTQGTRQAHLLFHAAMIYSQANRLTESREALRQALAINPRYNAFHAHR